MQSRGIRGSLSALIVAAGCGFSASQASALDGWTAKSANGRCFAISQPRSASQGSVSRGVAYASVQNSTTDGIRGSFSAVSGTTESSKGEVSLDVDGKTFEVLPFGEAAFVKTGAPETALLAAMKRGTALKVTWKLPSGQTVTDTYPLNGFAAAKEKIDRDCR
jgi:hypothetical protein